MKPILKTSFTSYKPVALINGPFFHHLDHLAPLCHFLNCPLVVDDKKTFDLGKQYYPEVDLHLSAIDLKELSKHYNMIILSTKYAKEELSRAYEAMNIHHMRFCFCPHGQSDKGHYDKTMISEQNQDLILFYGERQKNVIIPRGIQKLVNSEDSFGDFNQALAGGEADHVVHMVDAAGLKDQDADIGSTQFLKHERYSLKDNFIVVGNFRLAYYEKFKSHFNSLIDSELASFSNHKTILYAPTWNDHETATTFFQSWKELITHIPDTYNLVIKLHPLLEKHHPAHAYSALSFDRSKPGLRILFEMPLIYPLLNRIDIYLGDYSAIGYDFLYFNRPLFFLGSKPVPLHECGVKVASVREFIQNLDDEQHFLREKRLQEYHYTFSPFQI